MTTRTQHTPEVGPTPGPWRVANETRIEYGPFVGWSVAKILRDVPDEQWKANARLIAASPDLLAALKACEAYLQGVEEAAERMPAEIALQTTVKAALAKAGE